MEAPQAVPTAVPHARARKAQRRRKPAFHSRYVLLEKLGKGSFASVYLTVQAPPSEVAAELATKVIDLHAQKGGQSTVEKEAAMLKRVADIDHCVKFFGFHVVDGLGYIVMERCDCSLLCALKGMPMLRESSLVRVFGEMTLSLQGIHASGIVHRDVKPTNFLCSGPALTVKLCDFGFAEVEPRAAPGRPAARLRGVVGSAPFMSPEMVQSAGHTRKTDIWSLGVLMYVITLGHFPYVAIGPGASAMQAAIAEGQPSPSFELEASIDLGGGHCVSEVCKGLLRELLCRDQDARPEAKEALQHEWYSESAQHSTSLLRPALFSAKRAGAFGRDKSLREDRVDSLLRERQPRRQAAPVPGRGSQKKGCATQHPHAVELQGSPMNLKPDGTSLVSVTTAEPCSPRPPEV